MPKISRTSVENTIKAHCPHISAGDLRRARKRYMRNKSDGVDSADLPTREEALLLVKAIQYTDPTGDTAVGIRRAT